MPYPAEEGISERQTEDSGLRLIMMMRVLLYYENLLAEGNHQSRRDSRPQEQQLRTVVRCQKLWHFLASQTRCRSRSSQ